MSSGLAGFVEVDEIITRVLTSTNGQHSQLVRDAPQYVQDLLAEVRKVGVLTRHGAKMFPNLSVFDGDESDRLSSTLKSLSSIFAEIDNGLRYATKLPMSEGRDLVAVEQVCRSYLSRLKEHRM